MIQDPMNINQMIYHDEDSERIIYAIKYLFITNYLNKFKMRNKYLCDVLMKEVYFFLILFINRCFQTF